MGTEYDCGIRRHNSANRAVRSTLHWNLRTDWLPVRYPGGQVYIGHMKALLPIAAAAMVTLVAVTAVVLIVAQLTSTWDAFAKVAGVWTPVITSMLAGGISLWVMYTQQAANLQLELAKRDIQEDVEQTKTELATLLENHKNALAFQLESLKGRLSAKRKAYEDLWAAAILYYHSLAILEIGKLKSDHVEKAEGAMLASCAAIVVIDKEDRQLWLELWQAARSLGEEAVGAKDPESQKRLWQSRLGGFAKIVQKFEKEVTEKLAAL